MRKLLIALSLGVAALTASAPADAQPRYHDGYVRPGYARGHARNWNRPRYGGPRRDYGRPRHGRHRYSYFRNGRRYWGWR